VDPVNSLVLGFFEELIYEMPNKTIYLVMRPVLAQGDSAIHSSRWVRGAAGTGGRPGQLIGRPN
jgi:hypothetical protein